MTSPVSLVQLAQAGKDLFYLNQENVYFPNSGANELGQMETHHFWFVERRNLILSLLRRFLKSGSSEPFLGVDVGCGTGYTAVWLTEMGLPTIGMDAQCGFSDYRREGRAYGFVQGDLLSSQFKPELDFALLLDVLEHVPDDQAFVRKVSEMLKPGGLLLITVPAFSWLWSKEDEEGGHFRRYSFKDLTSRVDPEGCFLRLEYKTYFYFLLLPLFIISRLIKGTVNVGNVSKSVETHPSSWVNWIFKFMLRIEGQFVKYLPLPLGSSLFVVYRKVR